jgi:hypothetical protein
MAVSFYLEETIPFMKEAHLTLNSFIDLTSSQNWSLSVTAVTSDVLIVAPNDSMFSKDGDSINTEDIVDHVIGDFQNMSHSACVNTDAAEPFNFWDGILCMMRPIQDFQKKQKWDHQDISEYMTTYYFELYSLIRKYMLLQPVLEQRHQGMQQPKDVLKKEYEELLKENRTTYFPKLTYTRLKKDKAPSFVLLHVLGGLFCCQGSRSNLGQLINRKWRGQDDVPPTKIRGKSIMVSYFHEMLESGYANNVDD